MTAMNRLLMRGLETTAVVGGFLGVGSWAVDVATCPGNVESEVVGSDARVAVWYCDENPSEDGGFDRPGTPEQKLMYLGFGAGALSGSVIIASWIREEVVAHREARETETAA